MSFTWQDHSCRLFKLIVMGFELQTCSTSCGGTKESTNFIHSITEVVPARPSSMLFFYRISADYIIMCANLISFLLTSLKINYEFQLFMLTSLSSFIILCYKLISLHASGNNHACIVNINL